MDLVDGGKIAFGVIVACACGGEVRSGTGTGGPNGSGSSTDTGGATGVSSGTTGGGTATSGSGTAGGPDTSAAFGSGGGTATGGSGTAGGPDTSTAFGSGGAGVAGSGCAGGRCDPPSADAASRTRALPRARGRMPCRSIRTRDASGNPWLGARHQRSVARPWPLASTTTAPVGRRRAAAGRAG